VPDYAKPPGGGDDGASPPKEPQWKKNLKPIKPGEVRNKKGINGSRWISAMKKYFRERDKDFSNKDGEHVERWRNVMFAMYVTAMKGNPLSQRLIAEVLIGDGKQKLEITGAGGVAPVVMYVPYNGRGPAPGEILSEDGAGTDTGAADADVEGPEPSELPEAPPDLDPPREDEGGGEQG
jgi:hypothetical protein